MESLDVAELVERLGSREDAVRKMAVFKLQSNIGDPSFAETFIHEGGLRRLKHLNMTASGNTLAYSLTSLSRLLEVDKGWELVEQQLVERVVELVVTHPLVNILRGAMSVLVLIVSRPYYTGQSSASTPYGFKALKPAIGHHPQFLEMLVSRLSSADHALCANALLLINSLMRDAISTDEAAEWPKFIKKLQDLGVIKAVYILMQSSALQDLAHPLLEFQALTKVLLRKWRDVTVDLQKTDHRRALKGVHLVSNPEKSSDVGRSSEDTKHKHNPEKWRRLGFETETPASEFSEMGYLGMMDLTDYVRKHQDEYQRLLLEQSAVPLNKRCPIARASLAATAILYEHFEVDKTDLEDVKSYLGLESRTNFDKLFRPLLLHWSRLHVASLDAFFRLWKATGAMQEDFMRILELVRILVESVVGGAARTKDVQDVEEEFAAFEYERLRELQMELLELTYEDLWGPHLRQVRDELSHEATQFIREQRIRCLLEGSWFPSGAAATQLPDSGGPVQKGDNNPTATKGFRFVQLSHNRRFLHHADFEEMIKPNPTLDSLPSKIDLGVVSSVVSNVSASVADSQISGDSEKAKALTRSANTKITIHGYVSETTRGKSRRRSSVSSDTNATESVLLTLNPQTHSAASEWLDGLLMLLNQEPITAETSKLVNMISGYGLKIRLLNVRFDEQSMTGEAPILPSREGLDEDYYYEIPDGT